MGRTQICICCNKYRQTIIHCLILFASTSIFTNLVFVAEGRPISNHIEVAEVQNQVQNDKVMVSKAQIIGSRPPKCEGRCRNCGHCEAVMVPVAPLVQGHKSHYSATKAKTTTYSSRGDNLSNYKPLSWKCKCGDYYFNP